LKWLAGGIIMHPADISLKIAVLVYAGVLASNVSAISICYHCSNPAANVPVPLDWQTAGLLHMAEMSRPADPPLATKFHPFPCAPLIHRCLPALTHSLLNC